MAFEAAAKHTIRPFERALRFKWANQWCHADVSGALFLEEPGLLIVSDLHLEKASHFSAKGQFLPPYDSEKTLIKLEQVIEFFKPKEILSLGDAFHDGNGRNRLTARNMQRLKDMSKNHKFNWVVGNHDIQELQRSDLDICVELQSAGIRFVHEAEIASKDLANFEISGHFHPCATIMQRGRRLRRRCFAMDQDRMIMPAFGSLTGSLNISNPIYNRLFSFNDMNVILLGDRSVHQVPRSKCCVGR